MKLDIDFTQIPQSLAVDVKKGQTGVLIAELPEFDIFTEGDDLNDLFINVNDLIYTYFDIPKKYQNKICFVPTIETREKLIKIAEDKKTTNFSHFQVNTFYTEDMYKNILHV